MFAERARELPRLRRIRQSMSPTERNREHEAVTVPPDAPQRLKDLARKADSGHLSLLVDTYAQVLKVDDYISTQSDPDAPSPFWWWKRNRWNAKQGGVHRAALTYGAAYATVLPSPDDPRRPEMAAYSPFDMTAVYRRHDDEWPHEALLVTGDIGTNRPTHGTVQMFDDERVWDFHWSSSSDLGARRWPKGGWLVPITRDGYRHDLGHTPVVRWTDRYRLDGEETWGLVEPLIGVKERIHETTYQTLVVQYVQAFKQRYIVGWTPASEEEELKMHAARVWYLDPGTTDDGEDLAGNVKVGELDAADLRPLIDARNASIRDFAALGQIPAQALGVDGISNISDATLAGLEAAKNRNASEIATSLGESHEQFLRLTGEVSGNRLAAEDYSAEVRWRDFEARSFAATIDGLVKAVQGLGMPPEIALEDMPGMTGQKLDRVRAAMRRQSGRAVLSGLVAGGQSQGVDVMSQLGVSVDSGDNATR